MKNRIRIIRNAIIAVLFTSLVSCNVLDVELPSVISGNSFWKTEEDVKAAIQGMYTYLREVDEELFVLGESRAETSGLNASGSSGGYDIYFNNTLTSATVGVSWKPFYSLINSCNLIIKYADGIDFNSQADKNYYLAQAYVMRAYAYYVMARSWGDLIIRTEPVEGTDPKVLYKERSSVEDVFALIKSDIDKSIELFADHPSSGAPASGRIYWNKPAANALKGDVYLWTGKRLSGGEKDFTIALNALKEVKQPGVDLITDFGKIFDVSNKFNSELLFCAHYQKDERNNNFYWHTWLIQAGVPGNIDEETRNTLFPTGSGQSLTAPTRLLVDSYDPDDTRKAGTLYEIYTYGEDGSREYYQSVCMKGKGLVEAGQRYFMSHVILYRYADVLLMMAEVKNALGMDPSDEINQIRKRAYGENFGKHVFVSGSKEYNDEVILKERLLEFAFECKRWWDLLRFDKAFDLVPSLQNKKGKDYLKLFPISDDLLSKEPMVKQNPGYDD